MKFSENWLRTFVNPPLGSRELAHALTMAGLEVEALEPAAPPFDQVVVAEVLSVEKHPDADRLSLCRVNAGGNEPLQIVCGAPNVHVGAKVPCAMVGAELPGITIRKAKVRGVESSGMLCSARELGLSEEHSGLLLLPADAPVGENFRDYYQLNDTLFTLKLTPNRADCLSLAGVAREVAAITAASAGVPEIQPVPVEIPDALPVRVEAPEACPLYCGRIVRGIRFDAPTPRWMAHRLERSGLRSISAVVDITNYVMLELGQPLHAFDLSRISNAITVRYPRPGEKLDLLNGQSIELDSGLLMIADERKVLAVAGIMGGMESGVEAGTTDIFLESAFFSPHAIAGKSRRLGFATDSSHRFERGVDYANTRSALERATQLMRQICGGKAGPVTETKAALPKRDPIRLRAERVKRVLGIDFSDDQIAAILRRLQFSFVAEHGVFYVIPHSYRFDLAIEEDLIEELARIYGYDKIPASLPAGSLAMLPAPEGMREAYRLRQILAARGYQEVINYAFVDTQWERDFCDNGTPVELKNPIASQLSVMRSSLAGGLIANLRFNLNRRQARARLFEIGCCFYSAQHSKEKTEGYGQIEKLGGLCYGDAVEEQWGLESRPVDFFDAKADIEALFWPDFARFETAPHPALHPGRSARILLDGRYVGWLGELHPRWQQKYELAMPAVLFELELDVLKQRKLPIAGEISRFPPVRRDIAVVVDDAVSVQALFDRLNGAKPGIVSEIALFDVYRGKGIENGKKSLAFRVLLQDTQKTLTDDEVDAVIGQLVQVLEKQFGAKLRV